MSTNIEEIISIIESGKSLSEIANRIGEQFKHEKSLNILRILIMKLRKFDSCDISNEIRFLIESLGHRTIYFLKKIFEIAEKEIGELKFYIVNKNSLPSAWKAKASEGIEELEKYLIKYASIKQIIFIVTRKSFLDKLVATNKIFSQIFETQADWILATLAADNINEFWPKLEMVFIRESSLRPALTSLLPILHVVVHTKNKIEGLLFFEEMMRRFGLVARTWGRSAPCLKRIEQLINFLREKEGVDHILKGFYLLLSGEATLQDVASLIIASLPIDNDKKQSLILMNGCVPSEGFLRQILEDELSSNEIVAEISRVLMDAEKKWAPEVSVAELLGISWLTYPYPKLLREWLNDKLESMARSFVETIYLIPEELLDILKMALVIAVSQTKCKNDDCLLIVRMLYAIRKRFVEYPIVLLSYIIEALRNFSSEKLSAAIYLQRVLEIHGYRPYLVLLDDLFSQEEQKYVVAIENIIASRLGITARKVISLSMKNFEMLRLVNDILLKTDLKPRGITAPLYWELSQPPTPKLGGIVKLAIRYFDDSGVSPNKTLILLNELLELYSKVEEVKDAVKTKEVEKLVESYINLARFSSILEMLSKNLRRIYGHEESPLISKSKIIVSSLLGVLNDTWERVFLTNYQQLIESDSYFVFSIPKYLQKLYSEQPIILLVIDGLRMDDYLVKLRESLSNRGFIVKEERNLLALLPSITMISRKAIFGGREVLGTFIPMPGALKHRSYREEDFLKKNFGPNTEYLHGAIRHILNILRKKERENIFPKVMAIVLSELEKAAHGATEGFLARISAEYATEVSKIAELASKIARNKYGKTPLLVLASDHGLGLFTKVTEMNVNVIIKRLKQKGLFDPAHEPYVTERYAIIPLIGDEFIEPAKSMLEVEFQGRIHVISGKELGFDKIVLKVKDQELYDSIPASRTLILFPRGRRRFILEKRRLQRVVLHGGPLPVETIVPFAIFEYRG